MLNMCNEKLTGRSRLGKLCWLGLEDVVHAGGCASLKGTVQDDQGLLWHAGMHECMYPSQASTPLHTCLIIAIITTVIVSVDFVVCRHNLNAGLCCSPSSMLLSAGAPYNEQRQVAAVTENQHIVRQLLVQQRGSSQLCEATSLCLAGIDSLTAHRRVQFMLH